MSFEAFESAIISPALKRVAQHWRDVRGSRLMPGWSDIRPAQISGELGIIWSYNYNRASDTFVGRLAGDKIAFAFGKPIKGMSMRELYPAAHYQRLFDRAKRVVCGPEFYRGEGMVFRHLDRHGQGERIMLPMAGDGIHGDGVLGATDYVASTLGEFTETDAWFPL